MKLSFYAKAGNCVHSDGPKFVKQVNEYIGRKRKVVDGVAVHQATNDPYECDSESPEGIHAARHCAKGALWPADEQTAKHCGVEFVEVEMGDGGEFEPKTRRSAASRKTAAKAPEPTTAELS